MNGTTYGGLRRRTSQQAQEVNRKIAPHVDVTPDHPWQNFTAFKAKFGVEEIHLVPTLDLVFDDAANNHLHGH